MNMQPHYDPDFDPNLSHLIVYFVDEYGYQIHPSQTYSARPGSFVPYWPPKIKGYVEADRGGYYGYLSHTHTFPKGEPVTMECSIIYQETFRHRLLHGEIGRHIGKGIILAAALFYCALVQVYPQCIPINWFRQLIWSTEETVEVQEYAWANLALSSTGQNVLAEIAMRDSIQAFHEAAVQIGIPNDLPNSSSVSLNESPLTNNGNKPDPSNLPPQ